MSNKNTERITLPWHPFKLPFEPLWPGSLTRIIQAADVVQVHGIWQPHCAVAGLLSRRHKKPLLVSAHGMLDSWQLNSKRLKKTAYSWLFERPNLGGASCLRALTRSEADDYRAFGLTVPVAVIPNGVEVPEALDENNFFEEHYHLKGKRVVLFLGRLHEKKGLDLLCRAWAAVWKRFEDAHLVIAGPDYENTRAAVKRDIDELGLVERVTLLGMQRGSRKWNALAAAYVFVLPSYSEGFSVAILEALGCGVPVIASTACNFPEISQRGCGWVIEPKFDQLCHALSESLSLHCAQRNSMSLSAKKLVSDRYSWERIGTLMADTYDWVLGGDKPSNVDIRI